MVLDILQLRECRCITLLGAGGKSTLRALLEAESTRLGEPRTFYEAGSSGGSCLMLYAPGTLTLPPETDCAVIVAGLGALDWPIQEVCNGYGLKREFAAAPTRICDEHDLLCVVRDTLRAVDLPRERVRVLLNQADTGALHIRASGLLRALQDDGIHAAALSLLS